MTAFDRNAAGFDLLALMEEEQIQTGRNIFGSETFKAALPRLSEDQLSELARYLIYHELLTRAAAQRGPSYMDTIYKLTPGGKEILRYSRAKGLISLDFSSASQAMINNFQAPVNAGVIGNNSGTVNQTIGLSPAELTQVIASLEAVSVHLNSVSDLALREDVVSDVEQAKKAAVNGRGERVLQLAQNVAKNLKTALAMGAAAVELKEPLEHLWKLVFNS